MLLGTTPRKALRFHLPDSHRLRSAIPNHSATQTLYHSPPARQNQHKTIPQPRERNTRRLSHAHGLACSPFAHHYSGNHKCFLLLRVLRCFTSPRPHQLPYTFRQRRHPTTSARLPHSETPGSQPGCRLPEEYRRLPRPSSDPDAKASTMRPQQLENTKTNTKTEEDTRVHYTKLKKQPTHPRPPNKEQTRKGSGPKKTTPPNQGSPFSQDPTAHPNKKPEQKALAPAPSTPPHAPAHNPHREAVTNAGTQAGVPP